MEGFLDFFFKFLTTMFGGVWKSISNFFLGIFQIFNFPQYFKMLSNAANNDNFGAISWIFSILAFLLVYAFWAALVFMIALLIRKYVRFRKSMVGSEDLLEEIADLSRDVARVTKENERIMALKFGGSMSPAEIRAALKAEDGEAAAEAVLSAADGTEGTELGDDNDMPAAATGEKKDEGPAVGMPKRFFRLSAVDEKYEYYTRPDYVESMSLAEMCEDIRNFACSHSHLFYEIKIIRLMIAGLASTKMILLQGISGTGKTSLPYMMGKYFENDSTIASVQPSWRDRTELFGYFNEFTKKFNETEVLRRIYESGFNDDINIIILDEMNIARVEYYFAEMLSILEMPDPAEWKIELVPSSWDSDPHHLIDCKLQIPQNVWYVGTANNDDSTFAVSDKVYDRAFVINLDTKGVPFDAPVTESKRVPYSHVAALYEKAVAENPVSDETLDKVAQLDNYVIEKFRVAFGNRIMKQLKVFLPVYVACGGSEYEALDYLLATKVFRKFESLNLSLIRDEIKGLIMYMDNLFGKEVMGECYAFLRRLQRTF